MILRAIGLALLVASPLSAQAVSSLNPTDTTALAAQVAAAKASADASVKTVGGVAPDASGNAPLPNSFVSATCAGCTMSNTSLTGATAINGVAPATANDIAGEVSARNAAIAAITFPVTSVNGAGGAVTVPVYTDAQAVAANVTGITAATNLARAAAADAIQIATPATGGTVAAAAGTNVLFINNSALLASLTVTFPPSPTDGQRFTVAANNTITTLGFSGATSRGAAATLSASGYARFVWSASLAVWFRVG